MSRPIWKGYITFGLVNIPIVLYSGEKKFDIHFKLLDSRDKSRVHYLRVNENTGEEVPWDKIAKGYEYDEDNYLIVNEKELKEIAGEHYKTIDIDSFISEDSLDCLMFDKLYYLVPDKNGEKGYVILREVLAETKKIAIARVIIHTREYISVIMPYHNALILNLLHYPQEIKKPSEFDLPSESVKKYKISTKEIQIAKQLVDTMTSKWNPDDYHDVYRETLEKWIEEQIHHQAPKKARKKSAIKGTNVVNFIDLLKKSLAAKKTKKTKKK